MLRRSSGVLSMLWMSLWLPHSTALANEDPVHPVTHYTIWAASAPSRTEYEISVARLALDKTVGDYGPYELHVLTTPYSARRGHIQLLKGEYQFYVAGSALDYDEVRKHYLRIDIPIWRGLLGYRQLMVRSDRVGDFANVASIDALKAYVVGQGSNWGDIAVYKAAGIRVATAIGFDSLFAMLNAGRFDFLPFGVNEVHGLLATAQEHYDMTLVPNLVIHYPLNVYFQVGAQYPELATRLEQGLERAQEDGSFEALFRRYNQHITDYLKHPGLRLIQLESSLDE